METHPSISSIENNLIEDFSMFETWEEKYEYIIDIGKKLAPLGEQFKTEEYKIKGCQSSVWIHSFEKDGKRTRRRASCNHFNQSCNDADPTKTTFYG